MSQRVQVRDLARPPQLRPTASPVDTYYRPAEEGAAKPEKGNLAGLVKGLEELEPKINKVLDSKHKEWTEDEFKKGMAARAENQAKFKDAIDQGIIPEGASPWFLKGWQTQQGRLDGIDYDAALRQAWADDPIQNSDDPKAIGEFMQRHRTQFMKERAGDTQNPDWLDGFLPSINRAETNLSAQHIAHRQAEVSKQVRENTGIEIGKLIDQYNEATQWELGGADADARAAHLGGIISERLAGLVANGLSGRDANRIAAETVIAKAYQLRDPSLLRVPGNIRTGSGTLSGITDVREKIIQAERTLRAWEHDDITWGWRLMDRPHDLKMKAWAEETIEWEKGQRSRTLKNQSREEEARDIRTQMSLRVMHNPSKPLTHPDFKADYERLLKVDPQQAEALTNFRGALLSDRSRVDENKDVVNAISRDMHLSYESFDPNRIFQGLASRQFDTGRAMQLWDDWRRVRADGGDPMMGDPEFRHLLARMEPMIATDLQGKVTGAGQIEGTFGRTDLLDFARDFRKKNPNASISEFREAYRKRAKEILKDRAEIAASNSKAITEDPALKPPEKLGPPSPKPTPQQTVSAAAVIERLTVLEQERATAQASLSTVNPGAPVDGPGSRKFYEQQLPRITQEIEQLEKQLTSPEAAPEAAPKKPTAPPPAAVEELRRSPHTWRDFDKTFGPGAAAKALKGGVRK